MPELILPLGTVADLHLIFNFVDEIAAQHAWPERDHFFIKLAIEEACSNIFEHAYRGEPGRLMLAISSDDAVVTILLRDWSRAFDPTGVELPTTLGESLAARTPGGLGLYFIHKIVDEVRYYRGPAGSNNLELIKRLDRR